jgi:pimeloyl-ACP methyl ester carboxylesterase
MATLLLNDHPTWASIPKKKRPAVVLLHGGMDSSGAMLDTLGPRLARSFKVCAFDRRGHGRTADTPAPFHYDLMASETIAFLEYLGQPAQLVGHSDGAIVALLVAMHRPDLVRRVVAIGANYHYSALAPIDGFVDDESSFDEWARRYAELSPDGYAHARVVVDKAMKLFATEPTLTLEDLASIAVPVLVMAGDDEPIDLDHTCSMYDAIPDAQLCIVPGASHEVLRERPKESGRIIGRFLASKLPPRTLMPVRRKLRSD